MNQIFSQKAVLLSKTESQAKTFWVTQKLFSESYIEGWMERWEEMTSPPENSVLGFHIGKLRPLHFP